MAIYHLCRIAAYTLLGFVAGLVSSLALSGLRDAQAAYASYGGFAVGGVIFLFAFLQMKKLFGRSNRQVKHTAPAFRFARLVQSTLPFSPSISFGVATALLPCGFLYAALLQASVLAHPVASALSMLVFAVCSGPALGFGGMVLVGLQRRMPSLAAGSSILALIFAGLFAIGRSFEGKHDHGEHPGGHLHDSGPDAHR